MSGTHRLSSERSISLGPTTTIATKLLLASALAVIAFALLPTPAHAQGSLSLGSLTPPVGSTTACSGTNWFSYTSGSTTYPLNCFTTTVSCNNTASPGIGLTFGYLSPAVISKPVNGLVVFFNGGDGTVPAGDSTGTPSNPLSMLTYYFTQGYEIVQLAWGSPWEETDNPGQTTPYPANIQNAACRPATFLNYVYNTYFLPITQGTGGNPKAGMCAQGASAGSAQVAYSLAYYGAGSWLDNVELISGPVFSDINQGCEEPAAASVTVCPSGQWGCQLGSGGSSWALSPTYVTPANTQVGQWTYNSSCTSSSGTTSSSDQAWLNQSIVDQSTGAAGQGAIPTFTYPTSISAWLCRSLYHAVPNCNGGGFNPDLCPNNSSPQGEIFYSQITSSNAPAHYDIYAVDACDGPEQAGSSDSNVPGFYPTVFNGTVSGFTAITYDMAGPPPGSGLPVTAECTHVSH